MHSRLQTMLGSSSYCARMVVPQWSMVVFAGVSLQAKIVAMTCTHAALKRREFLDLAFKYDNLLMEEAGQILEIETFIPMLLQVSCTEHAFHTHGAVGKLHTG